MMWMCSTSVRSICICVCMYLYLCFHVFVFFVCIYLYLCFHVFVFVSRAVVWSSLGGFNWKGRDGNISKLAFVFVLVVFACICICIAMQSSLGRLEWGGTALSGNFTRISERILPFQLTRGIFHLTSPLGCTWNWDRLSFDEIWLWGRMQISHMRTSLIDLIPAHWLHTP